MDATVRAVVIPVTGPIRKIDLEPGLEPLQEIVGGLIQPIDLYNIRKEGEGHGTAYVNEEGKYECEPNMRATDFCCPGVVLMMGDYICGDMIVVGFDPMTGTHEDVPDGLVARIDAIAKEAAL